MALALLKEVGYDPSSPIRVPTRSHDWELKGTEGNFRSELKWEREKGKAKDRW